MMNDHQKALLLMMSIAIGLLLLVTHKPHQIDPVSAGGTRVHEHKTIP